MNTLNEENPNNDHMMDDKTDASNDDQYDDEFRKNAIS